jgi:hypothetical protein
VEPERARRPFDPGSLLMGLWFTIAGVLAAVLGDDLGGGFAAAIPISFAVAGVGLILPKRRR